MKQNNNAFCADFYCHFGDSSNYAVEGEGIPETLQRLAREQEAAKTQEKQISKRLLIGELWPTQD